MKRRLLSIGHGYSARALARRLLCDGWEVVGTTRSAEKAQRHAPDATDMVLFPGGDMGEELTRATHLLVSAGPDEGGDPFLASYADEVEEAAAHLQWAGYLSTTGVYGDRDGGWVTEDSPLAPTTLRGHRRRDAEAAWMALAEAGLPLHIFRLAGIYGPGRGPFAKVRSGTARRIIKEGQVFSRIHVEDIAQVLQASINAPDPGAIYNVCDDDPAPPEDVIAHAAELLGLPVPPAEPFDTAEMSPMARSFYAESKRVCNRRIKEELGVELIYPDYRAGLSALLRADHDA